MFDREKPVFERNSGELHPEHQCVSTRVSEYLIKYGQGKLDKMPNDTRQEIQDDRTVDQMLEDDDPTLSLGTEELDVLLASQEAAERFEKAQLDIKATQAQRVKFDNAVAVLQDKNASADARRSAYAILAKLEKDGKLVFDD